MRRLESGCVIVCDIPARGWFLPSVRNSCSGLFPSTTHSEECHRSHASSQTPTVWLTMLTHLLEAGHSGHGWTVSGGTAEVGGAAGTLPAAFVRRLYAATQQDSVIILKLIHRRILWGSFRRCATWHQRCAPCRGHIRGIGPSSWSPSSQPPPHLAGGLCCDPRRRILLPE